MEDIICQHCGAVNDYSLTPSGPHMKATCVRCNCYIKFVGSEKPAFTGTSLMPFGKHQGKQIQMIPPDYLLWLYRQPKCHKQVFSYIEANLESINREVNEAR